MIKNKKLIKRIGCLIGAFVVALVSICSIIPTKKQIIDYANADTFSSSYSSNWIPVALNASYSSTSSYTIFDSGSIKINMSDVGSGAISFNLEYQNFYLASGNTSSHIGSVISPVASTSWTPIARYDMSLSGSPFYASISYKYTGVGSVSAISRVKINTNNTSAHYNTGIDYFCGEDLFFSVALPISVPHGCNYNNFILPIITSTDSNYSLGYAQGQSAGYNSGYNTGYDIGLTDGRDIGYTNGYNVGKADGLALGGDYTFMSLFGAVFDAPIQALTGLLNFEILGVNLFNFVTSLFTLGLILALVKFLL